MSNMSNIGRNMSNIGQIQLYLSNKTMDRAGFGVKITVQLQIFTYWGRNFYFRHVGYQLMSNIGQMWKVCLFVCWNRSAGTAITKVPETQQL